MGLLQPTVLGYGQSILVEKSQRWELEAAAFSVKKRRYAHALSSWSPFLLSLDPIPRNGIIHSGWIKTSPQGMPRDPF